MAQSPEPVDNIRTALTGAGLGAVVLEVLRRVFDAWQRRDSQRSDQRQQTQRAARDAADQLRQYMERRVSDLEAQVHRLNEAADERLRRLEEMERKESRVNSAVVEFMAIISTVLPDMPETTRKVVRDAVDRVRRLSGLG